MQQNARNASYEGICENCGRRRGCGVPDEKCINKRDRHLTQREITERFVRGDSSKKNTEGSGLGLDNRQKFLVEIQERKILDRDGGGSFKAEIRWKLVDKKMISHNIYSI